MIARFDIEPMVRLLRCPSCWKVFAATDEEIERHENRHGGLFLCCGFALEPIKEIKT